MEQTLTEIKRPVNRDPRVGQFVLGAFFLGVLGAGSFIAGVMFLQPLYLAITFGAVLSGWMLFDRKRHHDGLHTTVINRPEPPQPPPDPIRAEVHSENGRVLRFGRYALTHDQWVALARVIFEHDDRFVRDVIAQANVFTNITSKWGNIKNDFERMGFVHNGQLTNDGITFFSNYSPYPDK